MLNLRQLFSTRPLSILAASLLGFEFAVQGAAKPSSHPHCKAIPGTPSWPSSRSWSALNESTGGRLLQAAPPGAVCHPGQPSYDPALCPAVQSGWSRYEFHSDDPVSSDWNHWNNDSCLPGWRDPCSGAGYPVFVVNATEAAHVSAAAKFGP